MSLVGALTDPVHGDEDRTPISERGPAPIHVVVAFGFWLFLLSDIVMFSALFAAYAVLSGQTAGGPTGPQLFDRMNVLIETGCLLASSFTCGLFIAVRRTRASRATTYLWAARHLRPGRRVPRRSRSPSSRA